MLSLAVKREVIRVITSDLKTNKDIQELKKVCCDILSGNNKQYKGVYKGTGKHTQYIINKYVNNLKYILDFKAGNDAPKGGKIGDYLIFKDNTKNRDVLLLLIEYLTIIIK